jgi:phosphoribosyl-AMP cyclohydrolase / phosphoribosyl-ATP pyrophosphohydrolase
MNFQVSDIERIDWNKGGGLVPAIVQHAVSASVLMLGYMNREALRATVDRGRVVFFSRSRQRLWEKGESSGHFLQLRDVQLDCDADTLLVTAVPAGPVCHTGAASCFGDAPVAAAERLAFLAQLEQIIAQRINELPQGSYTAALFAQGSRRIAQKVGEEGVEVALAGAGESDAQLLAEAADLLYHQLLLLRSRSLPLERVIALLQQRHTQRVLPAAAD